MNGSWRLGTMLACVALGLMAALTLVIAPDERAPSVSLGTTISAAAPTQGTSPRESAALKAPAEPAPPASPAVDSAAMVAVSRPALAQPMSVMTPRGGTAPHVGTTRLAGYPRVAPSTSVLPLPDNHLALAPEPSPLSQGPNLQGVLKLLDSLDPATREQMMNQGAEMLKNPALLNQAGPLLPGLLEGQGGGIPGLLNNLQGPPGPAARPAPADEPNPSGQAGPQIERRPGEAIAPSSKQPLPEPKARITHTPGHDEGDDHLVLNIQDTDIREVLELLAEQGELNILASPSVTGKVSASLKDVNIETALDAILKSTGFISRREGRLIFVGTPQEFATLKTSLDKINTRVYRLNYTTAKEMQVVLTPLLTPGLGKIALTTPSDVGIATSTTNAGGDSFAAAETVLVNDYEAVLQQIDEIVREIDRKPLQVAIEAMIISVTFNDNSTLGVDFQYLRDQQNVRFATGKARTDPLNGSGTTTPTGGVAGEFTFTQGGLQFAFMDDTLGAFINALETIGAVNVVAHPRLLCLNKQRAEILIGDQIGYITTNVTQTFSTQTINFLDVGTQLRLRPFISADGTIRLEVHPELSSGSVSQQGVPSKSVTQVTTNIMCNDGSTVVIGGLMQETLDQSTSQVPVVGSLPIVGPLFRTKTDKITRREVLVLITPRIVYDDEANKDGQKSAQVSHHRQETVAQESTLLSRVYQSRRYVRKAQAYLQQGDIPRARRYANLAVHIDPNNLDAIALVDETEAFRTPVPIAPGNVELLPPGASPHPLNGEVVSPWLLDGLEGKPVVPLVPLHPRVPDTPTVIKRIDPPEVIQNNVRP